MAKKDQMYVAKDTGQIEIDGTLYDFIKDRTFVAGDHPIIKRKGAEKLFEPVENKWSGVEQMTAAPGERRGSQDMDPTAVGEQSADQFAKEQGKVSEDQAKDEEKARAQSEKDQADALEEEEKAAKKPTRRRTRKKTTARKS